MWFQKISIPPPRRKLEIPGGWGVKGPGNSEEEGGLPVELCFQMVKFDAVQTSFKNRFLPTLQVFYIAKIALWVLDSQSLYI